jgi:hypothetical protein
MFYGGKCMRLISYICYQKGTFFYHFSPNTVIFPPRFLSDTRQIPKNTLPPSRELFLKIRRFPLRKAFL